MASTMMDAVDDEASDPTLRRDGRSIPPAPGATRSRSMPWELIVGIAAVAWSVVLYVIESKHYREFRTPRFDLGNMTQAVWNTAHGRPLEMTNAAGEQVLRLAAHVDPILVLLAPAWIVVPSPLTLIAIQIAACATGAIPVFWLARRHLGSEPLATVLALTYLAYPWLAWVALDAIHPVTLAIPLLLLALWYLDNARLVPFAVFAAAAALCGELVGLTIAMLGVWYAFARGRRRAGFTIAGAGTAWTALCLYVIIPASSGSESMFYALYESIGGSPEGAVRTLFTDPGAIPSELLEGSDLRLLVALVLPIAGLCLLAPGLALVPLPQLLANTLASIDASVDPRFHYVSVLIPFVVGASVLGVARLSERLQTYAAGAALTLALLCSVTIGPWTLAGERLAPHQGWVGGTPPREHLDALTDALALVPEGVPVASTNKLGSHLSDRRYIYSVPYLQDATWVILDERDPWVPPGKLTGSQTEDRNRPGVLKRTMAGLDAGTGWQRVFRRSDVSVYRRVLTR